MPAVVSVQERVTFVIVESGELSSKDIRDALGEISADPRLRPGSRLLVDATDMVAGPSIAELREGALLLRGLVERGITALAIVTRGSGITAHARLVEYWAKPFGAMVKLFSRRDDAERWISGV
jgi:hypothetical protein